MKDGIGTIRISDGSIIVEFRRGTKSSSCVYDSVTVEHLQDAARVLAAWMDVSYADVGMECRRVHERDQFRAELCEGIRPDMP